MSVVKITFPFVAVSLVLFTVSGCSFIREVTGEKEPLGLSPTGLGAATGAVVGSGVGAIIGSQSGNAGIGLAIGAASGAVLGGALGQQEDRENNSKEERNIRSARQDELLKANQNRIDEYKKGADLARERRGSLAVPRSNARSAYVNTPPGYKGNPRAVSFAQLDVAEEFSTPRAVAPKKVLVARVESTAGAKVRVISPKTETQPVLNAPAPAKVVSKTSQVDLVPQAQTVKVEPEKIDPAPVIVEQKLAKAATPDSRIHEADESMKTEISKATTTNGIIGVPVQSNKEIVEPSTEEIKTTVITGSKVGKAASDDDCSRADQEYQRATTSISDADKLFYLRRALRLCSAKPNLHLATGRVYSKLGRVEDAEYEFRQVLDLEPSNSEASKELASLKQGIR